MSKSGFTRAEPDARRQSLIEATASVLARDGAGGASVRAIALEAGVSPGLVTHHFGGVDALIAATYAQIGEQVSAALDAAVAGAGNDPRARLMAYVAASFLSPIADRALLATWTAFWGLVIARVEIAALHDTQYARYRDALEALLGACGLAPAARRRAAIAITALVDGLWLELCLSPAVLDATEARAIAEAQIEALLG
ncbi:AcrR family transcriptional regulator [Sphingomonas naasensis]|uniref:TetR family transcriptional regulator n=1 Tax=Sphingomonas naasensis TaxID=1344951 RepID=A0A4S1WUN7_9SPHN|nr:TetR family transcriptional regulator C-terminal domain-containing protein [Sphingomonas naasensis]NIJ18842.1 AcrR family transcriptional regulator [Sphingomonas naasensis]TGX46067.1 TetR family transcriptional regulator [Sphingomonas naasensis]